MLLLAWWVLECVTVASESDVAQLMARDGLCIQPDTSNPGSKVQMRACNGNLEQRWWFVDSDLRSDSGFCLTLEKPERSFGRLVMWPCLSPRGSGQQWDYDPVKGQLKVRGHNKCLESSAPKREYASVGSAACDFTIVKQQWDYSFPSSSTACDPPCAGISSCTKGRCVCPQDTFGEGCSLKCEKWCHDD